MTYPVTTFVHVDDITDVQESVCGSNCGENLTANGNMRDPSQCNVTASVVRHIDTTPNNCHGTSRSNCEECQSLPISQCPESRDHQSHCDFLPRTSVPTKTQCKFYHSESKGCRSQCSSASPNRPCDLTHCTPRPGLDLLPCTPPALTQCGSTSTPRENQTHCSSRASIPRNLPKCTPRLHPATKRNIIQWSNVPVTEHTLYQTPRECLDECSSYDVGHASHIPRVAPSQSTYEIPYIVPSNITTGTCTDFTHCGDIFGMVKLGENDVCYTSGTIEWVGRKRSYPINTGFKVIKETNLPNSDVKKQKTSNQTFTCNVDKAKDCDCADVLPTMNAIVDHLNALHEAVDIVDLRLNTLENVMTKNN